MATVTWLGGNGDFNDPANWDVTAVPGGSDDAVIGGSATVTDTGSNTIGTLTTGAAVTLELDGGAYLLANYGGTNAGTIEAVGAATFYLGSTYTLANTGTVSQTDGDTLTLAGIFDNSGGGNAGDIVADGAGSVVYFDNPSTVIGGTLSAINDGEIHTGYSLTLDGTGGGAEVKIEGSLFVDASALTLKGAIENQDTISVWGVVYGGGASGTVLSDGGDVRLTNGSYINVSAGVFDNVDNTITFVDDTVGGSGYVSIGGGGELLNRAGGTIRAIDSTGYASIGGDNTGVLTNHGLIESAGDGALLIQLTTITNTGTIDFGGSGASQGINTLGGTVTNSGTITASGDADDVQLTATFENSGTLSETGGGTLYVVGTIDNTGGDNAGTIVADGAGSTLVLYGNGTVIGGTLSGTDGGEILASHVTLDGTGTDEEVTLHGRTAVYEGMSVKGSIVNTGTIAVVGSISTSGANVELSGCGVIELAVSGSHIDAVGALVFENVNNTIIAVDDTVSGSSWIGATSYAEFINGADGIIRTVDSTGTFSVGGDATSTITNHGLIESAGDGSLDVQGAVMTNTGDIVFGGTGTNQALNTLGGTMTNSGTITVTSAADVLMTVNLGNTGTISEVGGGTLYITGAVDNTGDGNAGRILADGAGSVVHLHETVSVTGGTLCATDGGEFLVGYVLTLDGTGTGEEVTLHGPMYVPGGIVMKGSIVNMGSIGLTGSIVTGGANVELSGGGVIELAASTGHINPSGALVFENVDNTILIGDDTVVGSAWIGAGNYAEFINGAAGTIRALDSSGGGFTLGATDHTGVITNHGRVESDDGGSLTIQGTNITNTGDIVFGGTGATQLLDALDGTVTNSGTITAATTANVDITAVYYFSLGTIHNAGVIKEVGGGLLTIGGQLDNTGVVAALSGDILVTAVTTGGGTATVGGSSRFTFNTSSDNDVTFGSGTGILQFNDAGTFTGELNGFAADDALDVRNLLFGGGSSASWSGGVLTVTDGTTSYYFTLNGSYGGVTFNVTDDGAGGTLVTDDSAAFGTSGNDTLTASGSVTTLVGNGGTDTYVVPGLGSGSDVIENGVATANTPAGHLVFGAGIDETELWFDRVNDSGVISGSGDDLRITIMGTSQTVLIDEWFNPATSFAQLSDIQANGQQIDSGINTLIAAMATFEATYFSTFGVNFDPTAVSTITDMTVLGVVNAQWN